MCAHAHGVVDVRRAPEGDAMDEDDKTEGGEEGAKDDAPREGARAEAEEEEEEEDDDDDDDCTSIRSHVVCP